MLRLAYVRQTEDEGQMGRVTLEYFNHEGAAESDWAPMATVMAGDGVGLFAMPEDGDIVAVGFVNGDLNQPIVLGAIWHGAAKAPAEKPTERRFVSRNGHAITLSDGDDDGIILEDTHKNRIVMNADGITIETEGNLVLTVGGDTTFETSGEATHKASTIKLNP